MTIRKLIHAELEQIPEDKLEELYKIIRDFNTEIHKDTSDWDALGTLLEECKVETGISDLSYQHAHYLHGTPKRTEIE